MKICHVAEACVGGSGQVVFDLVSAQSKQDHAVTLIYSSGRADAKFLDNLKNIDGACLIALPMKREVGPHDVIDASRLYLAMRKYGPFDLIHSHSSKAGALARLVRLFLPRSVHVYMPHAFMTMSPRASRIYGWIELGLSYLADCIVVTSEQERQHAVLLGIPKRKLRHIPIGIDLDMAADRSAARKALGLELADFVIGFVGRLSDQKNPLRAIEAFALAAPHLPRAHLVIVGDGPLRDEVEQRVRERGLADRIHLLGNAYARILMPGFDCLLCTSDYESFGLIFIEALAAGIPLVTTNVGIVPELSNHGNIVFACRDFRPESLADGILELRRCLLTSNATLIALTAKQQVRNFSAPAMCKKINDLYTELTSAGQPKKHVRKCTTSVPVGEKACSG